MTALWLWFVFLAAIVMGLSYVRAVRQRRRDRQQIQEWLTECEQRREAWTPTEGDGIKPVRPRYPGRTH